MVATKTTATATKEYRRIGPPGCGKTTWIVRQAKRAIASWCERTGGQPWECRDVLIATLTTGAATELRSRGVEMPDEQISTLHSHAFRALDKPKLCIGRKETDLWNEECGNAGFHLSPEDGSRGDERDDSKETGGDHWRKLYHLHQAQLRPREQWSGRVVAFAEAYERWKRINNLMDFSDLIHRAWSDCETAPESPSIIFIDEAQDHDAAEMRLVRKWAEQAEVLVVVGDPDQNIYQFRGADPNAFYASDIPEENTKVLSQSYRVPRAVHAEALRMIRRCSNRKPIEYYPRDEQGLVQNFDVPLQGGGASEIVRDAGKRIKEGKTVMILASCHYMLGSVIKQLKESGIPMWNPFSKDNRGFNPLHPSTGTGGRARVLSYLVASEKIHGEGARLWTAKELHDWTSVCNAAGLLKHGAKTKLQKMSHRSDEIVLNYDDLGELFASPAVLAGLAASGISADWLRNRLNIKRSGSTRYALRVLTKQGYKALTEDPKVIVGTIHSVKGGEADCVYLSPEVSPKEREQLMAINDRDAVFRKFYVAMTRARETLVKLSPLRDGIEW